MTEIDRLRADLAIKTEQLEYKDKQLELMCARNVELQATINGIAGVNGELKTVCSAVDDEIKGGFMRAMRDKIVALESRMSWLENNVCLDGKSLNKILAEIEMWRIDRQAKVG